MFEKQIVFICLAKIAAYREWMKNQKCHRQVILINAGYCHIQRLNGKPIVVFLTLMGDIKLIFILQSPSSIVSLQEDEALQSVMIHFLHKKLTFYEKGHTP